MPKNPFLAEKIILNNGGSIETPSGTSIVSVSAGGSVTVSSSSTSFVDITTTGNSTFGNGGSDATQNNGTLTVGVDDTGYDVKFFGATSGKYWLWDESADQMVLAGSSAQTGNSQLTGTLTVGVNDTGHDVTFYGATAGKSLLWDESADKLIVTGDLGVTGATTLTGATQQTGTLTVGVDDTGHDVQFFGATTGKYMLWDESADKLIVVGTTDAGTSCEADAYTVGGVAGVDFGPAGVASITVVKGIVTAIS